VIIAIAAIALSFAFQRILYDQARAHIRTIAERIQNDVDPSHATGGSPILLLPIDADRLLTNQQQLDYYSSPTTYVTIDSFDGIPRGKSSNLAAPLPLDHPADGAFHVDRIRNEDLIVYDVPIFEGSHPTYTAIVAERLESINQLLLTAKRVLVLVALASAVVVVGVSMFIAKAAIEPITQLTIAMTEIGSDRLDRRLAWSGRSDEVGRLASAFNAMLARLQEAFARERQFISDASHELKTPLTVINANAQMLERWGDRDPVVRVDSLAAIRSESASLAAMVNGMLTLAKADSGDDVPKEPLILERLVDEVVVHARERAERKNLLLLYDGSAGTRSVVIGDPSLLRQLFANLIENAIKFTERGSIVVRSGASETEAIVEVLDSGVGIDPAVAEKLFDRFFRSDESHTRTVEGTGLGLAIVRSIARVHGGRVSAAPRPEGGSVFQVTLPIARETIIDP